MYADARTRTTGALALARPTVGRRAQVAGTDCRRSGASGRTRCMPAAVALAKTGWLLWRSAP
jgi:hypothetical protein